MKKKKGFWSVIRYWVRYFFDRVILWLYAKFFALMIGIFLSFFGRKRMSHNNGIGGEGWLEVTDNPDIPDHDFFEKGRKFPIRIRHASATFLDDAMNCIRSLSIKLSHERFKSPFDLEMNTGERSLFWSAASFLQFAKLRKEKWGVEYVEYNKKYPEGLKGAKLAVRRYASSFHNLRYYAKTPFLFIGKDEIKRYVKYRVIPYDKEKETGIEHGLVDWDVSNQRVLPTDDRGRNYLKYEYEDRIKDRGAKYRLQIQLRMAQDDENPEIFNNMVPWDAERFPWLDLAHFHIEKTLDWRESTLTTFSINQMPRTLRRIPARSIFDYNSLNYLRAHSEFARKMRSWSYRFFGMVPAIPDNENRNSEEWGK